MTMYITYEEYTEYGGTLDEIAFNNFAFKAGSVIDWWTFNRLQNEPEIPEKVKRCMFVVIDLLQTQDAATTVGASTTDNNTTKSAGIASESNDGVSTTYNTLSAKDALDSIDAKLASTITMYLQGVRNSLGHRLLYRGVYPDE